MKEYKNLATMVYESPISSTMTTISGNYSSDLARLFPHKSGETVEFYVTIMPNNELANSDNSEICKVSCADDGSNVTWTLLRGQRDTTAKDFNENAVITLAIYAEDVASKEYVDEKIEEVELYKFPNAIIIGEPTINAGQVSGFTATDYLQFPMILDFHNKAFVIDFCFTTGSDVTTQQNILDSNFGLALAIKDGKGLMAVSSNGTSWNIGSTAGTATIRANTTYYARLSWNGILYKTAISTDGTTYTDDMSLASNLRPYPTTMYIGGCDASVTGHTTHPFGGSINLNKAYLTVSGQIIWQGMDDAGLATRADVSLSNLDAEGEARLNAGKITPVQTLGTSETDVMSQKATTDAIYADYSKSWVKIGNDGAYSTSNVAIGGGAKNNTVYNSSVAIGKKAETKYGNSVAIGDYSVANKSGSLALGASANANGFEGVALGNYAKSGANYSLAIGTGGGTSSGSRTEANGAYSTAVGYIAVTSGESALALGRGTTASAKNSVALGTGANATKVGELNVQAGGTDGYDGTAYRLVSGVHDPVSAQDAATKKYVDDNIPTIPTLATVATTGSYNDLSDKPTIPTVNNATLTIQKNGTNVTTFTANASSNATANITVPTKSDVLGWIYPVGSIYMSVNSTNPATFIGGTWQRVQDTFLLAAGSTYGAGTTGGSATHHHAAGADMGAAVQFDGGAIYIRNVTGGVTATRAHTFGAGSEVGGSWGINRAEVTGNTSIDSNMPPYLAVYVWKRTA